jgi:hypothetical protein
MFKKQSYDEYRICDPIEQYAPYIIGFSAVGVLGWGMYLCYHLDFSKTLDEEMNPIGQIDPDFWMV